MVKYLAFLFAVLLSTINVYAGVTIGSAPFGGAPFSTRNIANPHTPRFNSYSPFKVHTKSPNYNNNYYNNHNRYMYNPQRRIYQRNKNFIPRTSFSDMNALEKYALNRNYGRESDLERIERLEMQTFGAIQGGELNSRYDNVRSAILARPKQNFKTSIIRGIGNYLSGQTTGFTPNLNTGFNNSWDNTGMFPMSGFSTSPYPTTAGNSSITEYSGPWGHGYYINNQSSGASSGVTILD